MRVTIVDHPLVQDRVAVLRDEATDRASFRRAARDLGAFLVYEATRDLATVAGTVRTPLAVDAPVRRIADPGPVVVPILRAGLGLVDGVLSALPEAEVGVIGLSRDEETFRPVAYCERLRDDLAGRSAFVLDPMLATGGSLVAACRMLAERGAAHLTAITVLCAPEGVRRVNDETPDVTIVTAALDERLDERAFIVPGLGDAGDRLFGPPA
jgi:uracil phosphoribosyltransferase